MNTHTHTHTHTLCIHTTEGSIFSISMLGPSLLESVLLSDEFILVSLTETTCKGRGGDEYKHITLLAPTASYIVISAATTHCI